MRILLGVLMGIASPGFAQELLPDEFTIDQTVRSESMVLVGISILGCTLFGEGDDWSMHLEGNELVVVYGQATVGAPDPNCSTAPATRRAWPSFSVALTSSDFLDSVPPVVESVRFDYVRELCDSGSPANCSVVTTFMGRSGIGSVVPEDPVSLEPGFWKREPGLNAGVSPTLSLRTDNELISLAWIGGAVEAGAQWFFAGGRVTNGVGSLATVIPSGGDESSLEFTTLNETTEVWVISPNQVWVSLPGSGGKTMSPWRPWAARPASTASWQEPDDRFGKTASIPDLAGVWVDVQRVFAETTGYFEVSGRRFVGPETVYDFEWDEGRGLVICGSEGICQFEDGTSERSVRVPVVAIGSERMFSPEVACPSVRGVCDGSLGTLFAVRVGSSAGG